MVLLLAFLFFSVKEKKCPDVKNGIIHSDCTNRVKRQLKAAVPFIITNKTISSQWN